MPNHAYQNFWIGVVFGVIAVLSSKAILNTTVLAHQQPLASSVLNHNKELTRLFLQDQSDRKPANGKPIDWTVVEPRDRAREARVKELYTTDRLYTGPDYYHAAMILQHALMPEDYLLAHELCVVAISKGVEDAKWLAAASEDRFLMSINRPQRFGTQYRSMDNQPIHLYEVTPAVTDSLRHDFNVPPLAQARERETLFNVHPKPKFDQKRE
ncbi:MAG: hypothetical protein JOZ78_25170 [Chroococcidiopsidaceae cyanobacterium CP_BM_ER_R8_30]|nr:hypothetical protein [Chroococcidiopsidaceae cyanobacterium CP_BM_ER_R8_30]